MNNENIKNAKTAVKRMTVTRLAGELAKFGAKYQARMTSLQDKLDDLGYLELCHEERLLNHAIHMVNIGIDLFDTERKDR